MSHSPEMLRVAAFIASGIASFGNSSRIVIVPAIDQEITAPIVFLLFYVIMKKVGKQYKKVVRKYMKII